MLRSCIEDVKNQSYQNLIHTINITHDPNEQGCDYSCLISDLLTEKQIIKDTVNQHTHLNNLYAIMSVPDYLSYDLFVKFDDDDIYLKNYLQEIVDTFEGNDKIDIVSSYIRNQLNGHTLYPGLYDNLGNEKLNYHMPMTYAFNKKALLAITKITNLWHFDDVLWREEWNKAGLINETVSNSRNIIWYIHGKNVSTGNFLKQ